MAHILLITHIYPPAIDGGSKVINKIGEYLQSQGHVIQVLTSNCHSTDDFTHPHRSIIRSDNRTIIRLPVYTIFHRPFKLLSKIIPIFSVFKTGPIFKLIPFIKATISIIKFKPDYIIAGPLPTTIVLIARIIKKLTNAKLLINASFHPTDPDFQNSILINTLKSADFIWTLTDFETNYFHQNFAIPKSKMINVGNGVDKSFLNPITNYKLPITNYKLPITNLLYVGSFAAHKGIATLVDAFVIVSKTLKLQRANALTLILAGQPTLYSPSIEAKIRLLPQNIKKNIKLVYNFKSNDLKEMLDNCTTLISPSTQESFGLVLIEALARGKPVIAASIPASSELINKTKGGLLFITNNSKDLAAKILMLHRSKDLRFSLGNHGFQYVQSHYTWDKIGKALWQKISS